MDCEQIWDLLSRYIDGEATSEEVATVEVHVSHCASCAHSLHFLRSTSKILAETPLVEPPPALQSAIFAATIYKPSLPERLVLLARRVFGPIPVRYAMMTAAGVATIVLWVVMQHPTEPIVSSPSSVPLRRIIVAEVPKMHPAIILPKSSSAPPSNRQASIRLHSPIRRVSLVKSTLLASVDRGSEGGLHTRKPTSPLLTPRKDASHPSLREQALDDKVKVPVVELNGDRGGSSPLPEERMIASSGPSFSPVKTTMPAEQANTPEVPPDTHNPHVVLTAASNVEILAGQIATLADLRRDLRRRAENRVADNLQPPRQDREIRIDVFRSSF
jgi:hypothetical protein